MRVFLMNTPGSYAGATVESWHTARLWRRYGIDVTIIPTWGISPEWREKVLAAGCRVIDTTGPTLHTVNELRGGIVVSFCNQEFLSAVPKLRVMGCKLVWANCMTFLLNKEIFVFYDRPPDMMVFHTEYQANRLIRGYTDSGVVLPPEKTTIIRGAFIAEDFKFQPRPHAPRDTFCVGKIARMDLDKWPPNMWDIQRKAQAKTPALICMLLLGVDHRVRAKLGHPPLWSVSLDANSVSPRDLYTVCHCLLPINGRAKENWPRVGLEAMASGVPIIAPNQWGWPEMIVNDHSGLLRDTPEEQADAIARLANDEEYRMFIANNAYARLREIANPDEIASKWISIFETLDARKD